MVEVLRCQTVLSNPYVRQRLLGRETGETETLQAPGASSRMDDQVKIATLSAE